MCKQMKFRNDDELHQDLWTEICRIICEASSTQQLDGVELSSFASNLEYLEGFYYLEVCRLAQISRLLNADSKGWRPSIGFLQSSLDLSLRSGSTRVKVLPYRDEPAVVSYDPMHGRGECCFAACLLDDDDPTAWELTDFIFRKDCLPDKDSFGVFLKPHLVYQVSKGLELLSEIDKKEASQESRHSENYWVEDLRALNYAATRNDAEGLVGGSTSRMLGDDWQELDLMDFAICFLNGLEKLSCGVPASKIRMRFPELAGLRQKALIANAVMQMRGFLTRNDQWKDQLSLSIAPVWSTLSTETRAAKMEARAVNAQSIEDQIQFEVPGNAEYLSMQISQMQKGYKLRFLLDPDTGPIKVGMTRKNDENSHVEMVSEHGMNDAMAYACWCPAGEYVLTIEIAGTELAIPLSLRL